MDYNRLAQSVAKKLAVYGRSVTLRQYPEGVGNYDYATLSTIVATPVEETRNALITEQPGARIGPQYGTNSQGLTVKAQKWIYLDANGSKPHPNDKVVFNNVEYNIVDVQETAPGGIVVFYLVVLMR